MSNILLNGVLCDIDKLCMAAPSRSHNYTHDRGKALWYLEATLAVCTS